MSLISLDQPNIEIMPDLIIDGDTLKKLEYDYLKSIDQKLKQIHIANRLMNHLFLGTQVLQKSPTLIKIQAPQSRYDTYLPYLCLLRKHFILIKPNINLNVLRSNKFQILL